MGLYLNQLPPTEVARLKAELAETLIAHFCYPRFYDYRVNALRMRPVDRSKRQEVWQYLNAVDFNVWGRVDVDSPDFQRQVERLLIHFVQRNRNFFGQQGRKRMVDVRALISSCSTSLADGLRGHLQGQQENPPFGSPRPVSSWTTTNVTGRPEPAWEQILPGTMQLQQQLQEVRGEARPASAPTPSIPPLPPAQAPATAARPGSGSVPSRRSRPVRPAANGASNGNGSSGYEEENLAWPPQGNRPPRPGDARISASFSVTPKEAEPELPAFPPFAAGADAAPTMPLSVNKQESHSAISPEMSPSQSPRGRRGGKPAEAAPAAPFASSPPADPSRRSVTPPSPSQPGSSSAQALQPAASAAPMRDMAAKQTENSTVLLSDEDVVIFEQMRHQLIVWLRVEAVRSGIELNGQGTFQLVEALRHQDGTDLSRLQVISTLLNMCDQIITSGRATLFDYKQAMMFYLMHTRHTR